MTRYECRKTQKMKCPNYHSCQLINIEGFLKSQSRREQYMEEYCSGKLENWKNCTRFRTHGALHFCPDFVFPDTGLTLDEIMDRFDNGSN
jgi:hypothetical protein